MILYNTHTKIPMMSKSDEQSFQRWKILYMGQWLFMMAIPYYAYIIRRFIVLQLIRLVELPFGVSMHISTPRVGLLSLRQLKSILSLYQPSSNYPVSTFECQDHGSREYERFVRSLRNAYQQFYDYSLHDATTFRESLPQLCDTYRLLDMINETDGLTPPPTEDQTNEDRTHPYPGSISNRPDVGKTDVTDRL